MPAISQRQASQRQPANDAARLRFRQLLKTRLGLFDAASPPAAEDIDIAQLSCRLSQRQHIFASCRIDSHASRIFSRIIIACFFYAFISITLAS